MYRAFFEYNESINSNLYKNFISKIINNKNVYSPNLSISNGQYDKYKKIAIQLDILEDFTYELKSSFQSYKDALGEVSSLAGNILGFFDKLNTANALGSTTTNGAELMKVQVWKETEPFRMNFKFSLQTKTDPFIDVYLPAILLSSQTILSPVVGEVSGKTEGNKKLAFRTPGVNQQKLSGSGEDKTYAYTNRNASSKVLDTFAILVRDIQPISQTGIAGSTKKVSDTEYRPDESILGEYNPLLSIDYAFIETAKPTWSKERTESGIPLWCELELTVQSVFSANDTMFSYLYPESLSKDNATAAQQVLGIGANAVVNKAVNVFR